jgi:hypothetical protein
MAVKSADYEVAVALGDTAAPVMLHPELRLLHRRGCRSSLLDGRNIRGNRTSTLTADQADTGRCTKSK